jgi:CDP-paratose 2-epimerase
LADHAWNVIAVDDLSRPGSALNVPRLEACGVQFVQADVRDAAALSTLPPADTIVVAAAETSVLAGVYDSPEQVISTNLMGAVNCFELARRGGGQVVFISSSRVYPAETVSMIGLVERPTRFEMARHQSIPGVSSRGISEEFPLLGRRTMYGATKLSAELLLAEYAATYGLRTVVDRFGVLAGPWQMAHSAQGIFTHWALSHAFDKPLRYIGYGGTGKQVRDLLHVDDAAALISEQVGAPELWAGGVYNVGGGAWVSLSLREATDICSSISGNVVDVATEPRERPGDIPIYISDMTALEVVTNWRPTRGPREILEDTYRWVLRYQAELRSTLL